MCLKSLQNRLFDVVIIGGGITGLGTALECAKNGLDVVIIEKDELSTQTSNNSLRIIHGGFRYLQTGNLFQIIDSIRDQARVIKESSTLVKSLPCIMPLKKYGLKSRLFVEPATRLYNHLAEQIRGVGNKATVLDGSFIDRHVPLLEGKAAHGALLWYDARVRDPLKLAALLAHRIDREGGEIVTHTTAQSIQKKQKLYETAVMVHGSQQEPLTATLTSRVVVNATGYAKEPLSVAGKSLQESIAWAAGYNVVLNQKIQERFAVGIQSNAGRLFFAVPRADVTALGTGYLPLQQLEDGKIPEHAVKSFLQEFSESANYPVCERDVAALEWGILPVRRISADGREVAFFGRSLIRDQQGYIEVAATKYTTFYSTGQRIFKRIIRYLA
jgi:glycerol-3-phosphate dehydrogenase